MLQQFVTTIPVGSNSATKRVCGLVSGLIFCSFGPIPQIFGPVRIDNSFSLETWAQEQESNPDPEFLWAARPMDRRTACPRFSGIKPPQANTELLTHAVKRDKPKKSLHQMEEESQLLMESTPATNQEPTLERGTGPQPGPMTTTLKQDNQVAKLRFLTNKRTPGPSAILLPLDPSTQFPQPCPSQHPDEPSMENFKFGGGVLYRPKDPALQTYCHF
ncbi:hypothetical protein DSO57_1028840 [Entomophthora muscae]|uniref:Uncharacterized protein n=1 Tax=Entomophthora muscae TaxID=34485 RepID=A0ACC2TZY9_9FUNG|nr:hypothetical protein DSO57_1028840 [Entomophthora muscae]